METKEIAEKYGLDLDNLTKEQLKLSKLLNFKDSIDFSSIERVGAVENLLVNNKIISVALVCDKEFNILEQQYFLDKLRFPYLYEFRSYREVPAMVGAFEKLNEKPDVVLIHGAGLIHPRLGLASHFSLAVSVPCIGVAEDLFELDKIEGENILKEDKKIGKVLISKEGSTPLYISPGDKISLNSSYSFVKSMIKSPHKLPEPLHLAHKYAREVKKELGL
jgi:deoxyribonuclease V